MQAWCNLQVKLCDPCLSAFWGSYGDALYKSTQRTTDVRLTLLYLTHRPTAGDFVYLLIRQSNANVNVGVGCIVKSCGSATQRDRRRPRIPVWSTEILPRRVIMQTELTDDQLRSTAYTGHCFASVDDRPVHHGSRLSGWLTGEHVTPV